MHRFTILAVLVCLIASPLAASTQRAPHIGVRAALVLGLALACSPAPPLPTQTAAPAPLDGAAIRRALEASGQPVSNVRIFTAETDPNRLLGRPDQYTAKVDWTDQRASGVGTIEVFPNAASLQARQQYAEQVSKTDGALAQHIVANPGRLALMRLPHDLTPEQAAAYEAWFGTL